MKAALRHAVEAFPGHARAAPGRRAMRAEPSSIAYSVVSADKEPSRKSKTRSNRLRWA